jgi:hypothetical protein
MAYTEKLLPVEALLGMWQNRRQQENAGPQDGKMAMIQKAMAEEQLKSMQEKNKMAELQRGLVTPGPTNPVLDSPYSIGFPAYQAEQEKMKYAAMATGQSLPNRGFSGGGESQPIPAQPQNEELNNAAVDIANEQAKTLRLKNQGYGSATSDLNQMTTNQALASKVAEMQGGSTSPVVDATIGGISRGFDSEALANAREFQRGQAGRENVLKSANAEERFRLGDTSALNDVGEDVATKLLGEKKKEFEETKLSNEVSKYYQDIYDTAEYRNVVAMAQTEPLYKEIMREIDSKIRDKVAKAKQSGKPLDYKRWIADLKKQVDARLVEQNKSE